MGNCDANSAKNNVHAKGQLEEKWKTEKIKEMVPRKSNHQKKRVTQVKRTFTLTTFTFFSWNHQLHFCSSSWKVSVQAQKWNRKQNARSIRVDNADDVYSGSLRHVHHYFISFSLFPSVAPLRKCTQRRLIKEQERKRKEKKKSEGTSPQTADDCRDNVHDWSKVCNGQIGLTSRSTALWCYFTRS